MSPEEQFERNLDQAFALLGALLETPSEIDRIPQGAAVIFMPSDDPELCAENDAMLHEMRKRDAVARRSQPQRQHALDDSTLLVNV
jgi:hypothetical protein